MMREMGGHKDRNFCRAAQPCRYTFIQVYMEVSSIITIKVSGEGGRMKHFKEMVWHL